RFGPSAVEGVEDSQSAYLRFRWEDERTRAELQLPLDDKSPLLIVADRQPAGRKAEQARLAHQRDEKERLARVEAGKPRNRLARSPGLINDMTSLEKLALGLGRSQVEALLPRGK